MHMLPCIGGKNYDWSLLYVIFSLLQKYSASFPWQESFQLLFITLMLLHKWQLELTCLTDVKKKKKSSHLVLREKL